MRTPTSAVLALTAAGVVLTTGPAHADTPAPHPTGTGTGTGWTVTRLPAIPRTGTDQQWTASTPTITVSTPTTSSPSTSASGPSGTRPSTSRPPGSGSSVAGASSRRRSSARTGTRRSTACRALTADRRWIVRSGDTLWRISVCTHHDLEDLAAVNRLPDGGRLIFPGDRITVPTAAASPARRR